MYRNNEGPTISAFRWVCHTTLDPVISASRSRVLASVLWREAKRTGQTEAFLAEWTAKRDDWMRRSCLVQRKWQATTRRPSRARHHDSIEIRERYVRGVA